MDASKRARRRAKRSCKHVMYIQLFSFIFHLALDCLGSEFTANAEKKVLKRRLAMLLCIKSSITASILRIAKVESTQAESSSVRWGLVVVATVENRLLFSDTTPNQSTGGHAGCGRSSSAKTRSRRGTH